MEHDKSRDWKTLKSEYLFRRPWLTVRRDEVELPNGTVNPEFYILEYPEWINVIAIDEDGKFVMVNQWRQGVQRCSYELCAGVVEEGETPLEGAKRELAEETGYTGGEWKEIMTISANPSTTNNFSHCFLARGVKRTTTQHLDATEDIRVELFTREQLYDYMQSGEMLQALMLAPLWKYFALDGNL